MTIPVIAGGMILVGLYFFPLGEDIVFKTILDSVNGDYWFARVIQYMIFGALIFAGFILLKFGIAGLKMFALVGLVIGGLLVLGIV
jgi:hypothetical protein